MLAMSGSSFRRMLYRPKPYDQGRYCWGCLAGNRGWCAVVQDTPDIGRADVGCTPGVCCRDHAQLDPAAYGVLADMVAVADEVAVDLPDGPCLKSLCGHVCYLLFS